MIKYFCVNVISIAYFQIVRIFVCIVKSDIGNFKTVMNSPNRPLSVTAITDKPDIVRFLAAVSGVRSHIVDMSEPVISSIPQAPIVFLDVDLTDAGRVVKLKQILSNVSLQSKKVFLVDKGAHSQATQAKGLGAVCVVPRPMTIRNFGEVVKLCQLQLPEGRGFHSSRGSSEPDADKPSIAAAAEALTSVFSSLSHAAILDMASVNEASDMVIDAVANVGIDRWLHSVRTHHVGTFQHCLLVTGVATSFGQTLSLTSSQLHLLTSAALLHDIGKARIPLSILNKAGHLTEEEFAIIKLHPVYGHEYLLTQKDIPKDVLHGVRHHHEYLDGSGYPDKLSDADIPDITRILTVCDIYGALIEKRAYKKPRTPEEAMVILRDLADKGKVDRALTRALDASVC
jgi:HD-GYP domain-containing protein (c-di-GMP phosphodiesterase class II)